MTIQIRVNDDETYDLVSLTRHEILALRDAMSDSSRPLTKELLSGLPDLIEVAVPFTSDV